jgi:YesN/AraC family two-component response regulator
VAFLDIRMPGLTGLEVAAATADVSPQTQVVFVTAYNQHAIEAFDRGAVDYLLKPISADRLAATDRGRLLLRIIAACFDRYLHQHYALYSWGGSEELEEHFAGSWPHQVLHVARWIAHLEHQARTREQVVR